MRGWKRIIGGALLVGLALLGQGRLSPVAADPCTALIGLVFGAAEVKSARAIAPPFRIASPYREETTEVDAPFCRVIGVIRPEAGSEITFEVWLPPAAQWNGRYEGVGNGGFAGSLVYRAMAEGMAAGYATSATDTGHGGAFDDARWAIGHPERVRDFGERAIHLTALAARAVIAVYYGRPAAWSYFSGCSDGGREALMEAERYPEDYDGIIAGAPAAPWVALTTGAVAGALALAAPGAALTLEKLDAIAAAAAAACAGGAEVIADPEACRFDPAALACTVRSAPGCLSPADLAALRFFYGGLTDREGHTLLPGFTPGSEREWRVWIVPVRPGELSFQRRLGTAFFADFIAEDPLWTPQGFDPPAAYAAAEAKYGAVLDATDPDLSRFAARGGRLILYHGWYDPAIPARATLDYFHAVQKAAGGPERAAAFVRLFMVPGMAHCGHGPGANAFGGVFGLPAPRRDAEHDVLAALDAWVREGRAPERLVATKYRNDDPAQGVAGETVLTPHP